MLAFTEHNPSFDASPVPFRATAARAPALYYRPFQLRPADGPGVQHLFNRRASSLSFAAPAIRKDVDHLAGQNRLLQAFPVIRVVQFAMQLGEQLP